MRVVWLVAFAFAAPLNPADNVGRILRPVDKAALSSDRIDIIATAQGGSLELDGKPIAAEQPFPNVLRATVQASPGEHKLALLSGESRQEIKIFVGPGAPAVYTAFRIHPPVAAECTQCHEVNRRGRFRFKGGCFDCHKQEGFAKTHSHTAEVLAECGLCHNAHGSTAKAHLTLPKETACKQCHN